MYLYKVKHTHHWINRIAQCELRTAKYTNVYINVCYILYTNRNIMAMNAVNAVGCWMHERKIKITKEERKGTNQEECERIVTKGINCCKIVVVCLISNWRTDRTEWLKEEFKTKKLNCWQRICEYFLNAASWTRFFFFN